MYKGYGVKYLVKFVWGYGSQSAFAKQSDNTEIRDRDWQFKRYELTYDMIRGTFALIS